MTESVTLSLEMSMLIIKLLLLLISVLAIIIGFSLLQAVNGVKKANESIVRQNDELIDLLHDIEDHTSSVRNNVTEIACSDAINNDPSGNEEHL